MYCNTENQLLHPPVSQGEAIKHFIRKLQSADIKFFYCGEAIVTLVLSRYLPSAYKTYRGKCYSNLVNTETIWWRRQRVIIRIKAKCFHGEACLCPVYSWQLSTLLNREKSVLPLVFEKACLSFLGLYLCLKWRLSTVQPHFLLRYIWNYLKGRWYYPQ